MNIMESLQAAEPRPANSATREDKKNYAERLSRALAKQFASALRDDFPGITPDPDGKRQEAPARTSKGFKKLDVNYSTPELGLGLGVSIKTLNYRDAKTKRYTKNYTRIDNELRAEANDYHERQPFAVLVAIVFMPVDCCDDGLKGNPSSFGQAIKVFRSRSERTSPQEQHNLFEKLFVGSYTFEGEKAGDVWFFDVADAPPSNGIPDERRCLSFEQLVAVIRDTYDARNKPPFHWADGSDQ
ncbi:MAG TPA: hypothetical protein PLV92_02610 [Pirellulaceae bacterium]|nr:hypothetical protein [Pirellulaceae bacterium]